MPVTIRSKFLFQNTPREIFCQQPKMSNVGYVSVANKVNGESFFEHIEKNEHLHIGRQHLFYEAKIPKTLYSVC